MGSPARRPRTRHVAFRVEADRPPSRSDMVDAVRGVVAHVHGSDVLASMDPWLTVFDGTQGLVRVRHRFRDELVEALRAIRWVGERGNEATVTPLGTSGTIRAARRRFLDG